MRAADGREADTNIEPATTLTGLPLDLFTHPLRALTRRALCLLFTAALDACTGTAERSAAVTTVREDSRRGAARRWWLLRSRARFWGGGGETPMMFGI